MPGDPDLRQRRPDRRDRLVQPVEGQDDDVGIVPAGWRMRRAGDMGDHNAPRTGGIAR